MAPLPTRRAGRSLVASAFRVGDRDSDFERRKGLPWQERALEVVKLVPELSFASRFYSKMLKQLRLYPAKLGEDGQIEEITDGLPVEVLNRVRDPGGGQTQILGSYGRLMFITGEGLLFGRDLGQPREKWSFVWNGEVEVDTDSQGNPRKYVHKLGGAKTREYTPEQAVVYRMWTPSPQRSHEAESPMLAGLQIAEELILLGKSVMSTATSRLVKGLLFMPIDIIPPAAEPGADEDPEVDPWVADFLEHVVTQIENPGSAEAASPLISWVQGDQIENIKWIPVHDPQSDYMEQNLRKELIDRLSYGLDMPPEALKGLGDSNHWAAMQILGDMWKSHGAPVAQQFCEELSSAYFQPALEEGGYADWQNTVVAYDAAQVVVKADRAEDAREAAKLAFISPRGYRIMTNIPEEYAPSEKERQEILEALGRSQKQQAARRGDPAANGSANGTGRDPAADGPPPPGPEGDSGRRTRVVTSSAESYEAMGAAMMALARCRELAGIRLYQKHRNCPDCFDQADGQPHALVASIVGPEVVSKVGWDPVRLVRGGTDTFRDMLIYWDYSDKQAEAICEMIESFAARTLYDSRLPQLPTGFASHLEHARELEYID